MSGLKDIVRGGWHPEKAGTTLKGQVKSLVGRGDKSNSSSSANHVARPISSLQDPASFGPPPQRREIRAPPTYYAATNASAAPQSEQSSSDPPNPPPQTSGVVTPSSQPGFKRPPPPLPPRLPPRTNPPSSASPSPASPPSEAAAAPTPVQVNQGAIDRLGRAGISVPGLGIGGGGARETSSPSAGGAPALNELQSRFSRLGTSSSSSTAGNPAPAPTQGTTWAQKQEALRTAAALRQNPSSVSLSDVKSAASTANNFRQRHGDQVAAGAKAANGLNEKYAITNRIGALAGSGDGTATPDTTAPAAVTGGQLSSASARSSLRSAATAVSTGGSLLAARKKPPPPPPPLPKKKVDSPASRPELGEGRDAPPPVPMATRPQF